MRLKLFIALLSSLALAVLFWVGSRSDTTAVPAQNISQKKEPLVLRLGHNTPHESALHAAAQRFAAQIWEATHGAVRIDVYPNQELGTDDEMMEMARNGQLDIVLTPTAKMSVLSPSMQYVDLPFYFQNRQELYAMLDGEVGYLLLERLRESGLIGVTFWENGFKQFTSNFPIDAPHDFKNKKVRVMKSRLIMEQFRVLGAQPVSIDFHATYQALADKVVDAQENPLIAIYSMGFYKEQKQLTLTDHAYLGYVVSISAKRFEALGDEVRQMLIENLRAVTPWEREETQRREAILIEEMRASGIEIVRMPQKVVREFERAFAPLAKKFEREIGAHILSKTEAIRLANDTRHEECYYVGLSADLSQSTKAAGLAIKRGIELALARINSAGGILGHEVHLVAMDHQGLATLGERHVDELLSIPNMLAIFGGVQSAAVVAQKSHFAALPIPFLLTWSASSINVQSSLGNIFRVSANDTWVSKKLTDFALGKGQKPLILYEKSIWGEENQRNMMHYATSLGIDSAHAVGFSRGDAFEGELLWKIIEDIDYDVVLLIANPTEAGHIVEYLASQPHKTPIVSHWGVLGSDFYYQHIGALRNLDLAIFTTFAFDEAHMTPQARHLFASYQHAYHLDETTSIEAPQGVAHAYDAMGMLERAVVLAKSTQPKAIVRGLQRIEHYEGVVQRYEKPFGAEDYEAISVQNYRMVQYAPNAHMVLYKVKQP